MGYRYIHVYVHVCMHIHHVHVRTKHSEDVCQAGEELALLESGSSELRSWPVSPSPSPSPLPCWPAGDESCALAKQPVRTVCICV